MMKTNGSTARLASRLASLPPQVWIELITVTEGLRPAALMCVSEAEIPLWQSIAAEIDFVCFVPDYALACVGEEHGNHLLQRVPPRLAERREVVLAKSMEMAQRVAETNNDVERGRALGYPSCCVRSYADRGQNADWLRPLLAATPRAAILPAACNRLSMLMDQYSLVPDYFPCSLACAATQRLGDQIAAALRRRGLDQLLQRIVSRITHPIVITPLACARLPHAGSNVATDVVPLSQPAGEEVDELAVTNEQYVARCGGAVVRYWPRDDPEVRVLHFLPPAGT